MADTPDSTDPASRGALNSMVDEGWAVEADDAAAATTRTGAVEAPSRTAAGDTPTRTRAGDTADRPETADTAEGPEAAGTTGHPETTGTTCRPEATGTTGRSEAADTTVLTAAMSASSTKIVTTSEFRMRLSELLELASRQPVTVASRGERARGVLVSPDFFDRACDALGEEPYARPPRTRLEELMEEAKQILELL